MSIEIEEVRDLMRQDKFDDLDLSDVFEVAIEDLKLTFSDPKYFVYMNVFHLPVTRVGKNIQWNINGTKPEADCVVCMAGAVMAKTYNTSITASIQDINYSVPEIGAKRDRDFLLRALDSLRSGNIPEAVNYWYSNSKVLDLVKCKELRNKLLDTDDFDINEISSQNIYLHGLHDILLFLRSSLL